MSGARPHARLVSTVWTWSDKALDRPIRPGNTWRCESDERKAFDDRDVAAFYQMGLHEVLINRYARAAGYARDDYRKILEPFGKPEERRGRWQK